MADVFISYSQAAKEATVTLAAGLVKRGYDPWYDVNLLPGQAFGKVIDTEIDAAKAVITIWSRPALTSTWVPAESERAHGQGKLISVLTPDVEPRELPTPFNRLHAGRADDLDAIIAAIAAKGVRPLGTSTEALPAEHRVLAEAAVAWQGLKDHGGIVEIERFLERYYAAALYRELAQARLAELRHRGTPPPVRMVMPDDVQLRIDPGMHTAVINRISLSADGLLMATASDDKTVRLWALPEGRLVRTLRPPIGPGNDGKVYAVALAPDGRWAAAGGWDVGYRSETEGACHVYIFDTATGAVSARLGPLPNVINDLEVSPDGRRLAAGLGGKNGIRVWAFSPSPRARVEGGGEGQPRTTAPAAAPHPDPLPMAEGPWGEGGSWSLAFEDRDYGGAVYGLAFAADGRLATTCWDGAIRLYDVDGACIAKAEAPGGKRPYGIAFAPDGTRLAVGYADSTQVDVLDAGTLAPLFAADTTGVDNGNLSKVAWSADGARLAAAGRYQVDGKSRILVWPDGGRGPRASWPGPADTVMDLAAWGDGLAYGGGDPAFGLIDAHGRRVLHRGPPLADLRNKLREHFLVSADGRRLRFGLEPWSDAPILLDLAGPSLTPSPAVLADLKPADTTSLAIDGWINTTQPTLSVKQGWFRAARKLPLPLRPYEIARSLAIAPDGKSFILGTEWLLRRFDAAGVQQWEQPVPGVVWGVNLARDGRLVIAAYADGSIRWHRAADGAELLACFIHVDWSGDEPKPRGWVVWTPKGHYACAPGSQDLIGWHVNRGPSEAADFYPASTFASTFHKPDVVARALDDL